MPDRDRHPTRLLAALGAGLLLAACGGSSAAGDAAGAGGATGPTGSTGPTGPTGPATGAVLVASGRAGAFQVAVRSDRAPGTGIAALEISISDGAGAPVTVGVDLAARRPASGLPAPVVAGPAPTSPGVHAASVAFAEAGSGDQGWTLRVGVTPAGGIREEVEFPGIAVLERRLGGTFLADGQTILLAVRFEGALRVGQNPVTVSLHAVGAGTADPVPVTDATLQAVPLMPSMGHGSTGTVDPAPTAVPGLHAGSIAFSMPGDWETTFTVRRGDRVLGSVATLVFF